MRSLLSLISYLGSGEYRKRYLGLKIPPTNLQEDQLEEARRFADALAERLPEAAATAAWSAGISSVDSPDQDDAHDRARA